MLAQHACLRQQSWHMRPILPSPPPLPSLLSTDNTLSLTAYLLLLLPQTYTLPPSPLQAMAPTQLVTAGFPPGWWASNVSWQFCWKRFSWASYSPKSVIPRAEAEPSSSVNARALRDVTAYSSCELFLGTRGGGGVRHSIYACVCVCVGGGGPRQGKGGMQCAREVAGGKGVHELASVVCIAEGRGCAWKQGEGEWGRRGRAAAGHVIVCECASIALWASILKV